MHDRNGVPIKIGDRVRIYGTRSAPLSGRESIYGQVGVVQRVSDPDYFKGLELEVSVERNGRVFEGGGVNGDWLITSNLCEKVIEAICAECDSIHGELDYLCPSCRLTV
jgi:hypothetical protein